MKPCFSIATTSRKKWILPACVALTVTPCFAQPGLDFCGSDGFQASGAVYRFCVPPPGFWNGELVVFAHGFVPPTIPVSIPEDQLFIEGVSLPGLANGLGYAFGVSSFSTNGFAIPEGLADTVDLVDIFAMQYGPPLRTYIIGSSQGGLITALALERYPDVFDGGVSVCGAVGDFGDELNYVGDFHVLFDYFFPGVLPGDPTGIPQEVIDNWETVYIPRIRMAIWSNVPRTVRLLITARAPVDLYDLDNLVASIDQTVLNLLWYNVFATNDAIVKLGGEPYDNTFRRYPGFLINRRIPRYSADPIALERLEADYITSGDLGGPIVTAHTLLDEVIPYKQQILYRIKNFHQGDLMLNTHFPVPRYGHCNFTLDELLSAFAVIVEQVTGEPPVGWPIPLASVSRDVRPQFNATQLPPPGPTIRALQADVDMEEVVRLFSDGGYLDHPAAPPRHAPEWAGGVRR